MYKFFKMTMITSVAAMTLWNCSKEKSNTTTSTTTANSTRIDGAADPSARISNEAARYDSIDMATKSNAETFLMNNGWATKQCTTVGDREAKVKAFVRTALKFSKGPNNNLLISFMDQNYADGLCKSTPIGARPVVANMTGLPVTIRDVTQQVKTSQEFTGYKILLIHWTGTGKDGDTAYLKSKYELIALPPSANDADDDSDSGLYFYASAPYDKVTQLPGVLTMTNAKSKGNTVLFTSI